MKKLTLLLLCNLTLVFAASAQIVITEIMYNPPEGGVDSLEFIEIYNNSANTVDLSDWSFSQGVTYTFAAGTTLAPGAYLVIAESESAFSSVFGFQPLIWDGALTNSPGEDIALVDANGTLIDSVDYLNMAPWPTGANGFGNSLVLCDPNADNLLPENWQDALTPTGVTINGREIFANPGAASNCPTGVTAITDEAVVLSGESTAINVLQNDNLPGTTPPVVTITGNPANGNATVNPDNTISYTSNTGYCGSDMLTYQVCENSDCDEAQVFITVQCYPQYTIDQINDVDGNGVADSSGVYCELTATTYGVNLRPGGLQFTMIDDNNNGITILNFTGNYGYTVTEGDKITVRGVINQFNGLLQIFPDTLWKVSAGNPLVTPLAVQVHNENTESKLIRINNLRYVDQAQWATGVGTGFSVFMVSDDHPLDTIQVRIDNDVDLFNQPAPPAPFDLTGIGGQFDTSDPFTGGYQIAPRYTQDVSTLVGIREADFSANVLLSPNPATEILRLQTDISFDALHIFTATGQLKQAVRQPSRQLDIPLGDFAEGVYFIRFEKDGAAWTTRFVKL
ncbi:MAG: lamin tail domain-containing protein [Saprospiraceae bacterium]